MKGLKLLNTFTTLLKKKQSELNLIREEENNQNPDGDQTQSGDKEELQLPNLSSQYTTKGTES